MKVDFSLYGIMSFKGKNFDYIENSLVSAIKGGMTLFQIREKNIKYEDYVDIAKVAKDICDKYNIPIVVNDNLDVANKIGASGLHIGQSDTALDYAKENFDGEFIGVTVKTIEQARNAQTKGASYLGIGAFFDTQTKLDAIKLDWDYFEELRKEIYSPVTGIGGINLENIDFLKKFKLNGFAISSGLFNKDDIEKEARLLKEKIDRIKLINNFNT